jgi:hypothetical protein
MANPGMIVVNPAELLYRRDTHEHQAWTLLADTPDIRVFFMAVTDRPNGRVTGNIYDMELSSIQDSIRGQGFFFTHLDAEMKGGTDRRFTLEEWDAMDMRGRDQLKSWTKHYNPADEARLSTLMDSFRWACEDSRNPVGVGEFLLQLSEPYMAKADNPQPGMLRVAPEAAKEILAQDAADVYRLMPKGMEKLPPIEAVRLPMYSYFREFAVKAHDWAGIEKWAQRSAGDMLRQQGRGGHNKSRNAEL